LISKTQDGGVEVAEVYVDLEARDASIYPRGASDARELFHRRTCSAYNRCLAWYNVVLTARSLKREIQITGLVQSANICDVSNQPVYA